ncbi:MAG TPA: hypothetical protein VJT82_07455, partial [Pyrinomonadaceae bacterium]|nr:hypothetical protein [Pyrinomonadaceae bacterium]
MRTHSHKQNQPQPKASLRRNKLTLHTNGLQAAPESQRADDEGRKSAPDVPPTTHGGRDFSRIPVRYDAPARL